jgi:hypothetical protein
MQSPWWEGYLRTWCQYGKEILKVWAWMMVAYGIIQRISALKVGLDLAVCIDEDYFEFLAWGLVAAGETRV